MSPRTLGERGAIRAITFDVGGTLLRVHSTVGEIYAEAGRHRGLDLEPAMLQARFEHAWVHSLERSRERGYRTSDAILRDEWRRIVGDTFPPHAPEDKVAEAFEDLYERFSTAGAWSIAPGARESIEWLRGRGIRLGVLSNWDSRLPVLLEDLRLGAIFDFHSISYAVGFEKPHPDAFRHALERAGARSEETLHVGDSLVADILPARGLGIRTLWVASAAERTRAPDAGLVIEHFPEDPRVFWEPILA
jgi:putative hydrolase of the HAD superfamily